MQRQTKKQLTGIALYTGLKVGMLLAFRAACKRAAKQGNGWPTAIVE